MGGQFEPIHSGKLDGSSHQILEGKEIVGLKQKIMIKRCSWCNSSEWIKKYHDDEWGRPLHDEQKLFEMLILEGKSCGLSWELILKKREHMRIVFDNFDPELLVSYDDSKIDELMQDPGVIRHRLKIKAVIDNAKAYFKVKELYGSFDNFLWSHANHQPIKSYFFILKKNLDISPPPGGIR